MKSTLLKSALTVIAAFAIGSASAQWDGTTNYTNTDETIYQTVNLGMKLYVLPDDQFSPNYITDGSMSSLSQWRWETGGTAWATGTTQLKDWTTGENYVELNAAAINAIGAGKTLVVRVKERFNVAGLCESNTASTKTIAVVGEPSIATFAGTNATTSWTVASANNYTYCGEGLTETLSLTFTETGVLAAMALYDYGVAVEQEWFDGNMTSQGTADVTATYGRTADPTTSTNFTAGTTHSVAAMPMHMTGTTKDITRYTFTLAVNSLTSKTSRVSHKRAGVADAAYAVPTTTITYTLYPTPTTGPIYHIANNFTY